MVSFISIFSVLFHFFFQIFITPKTQSIQQCRGCFDNAKLMGIKSLLNLGCISSDMVKTRLKCVCVPYFNEKRI